MTEIIYVNGDATTPIGTEKKHIVHVCNDLGYWGRGFVMAISAKWDEPKRQYVNWKKNDFADPLFELGQIQAVPVEEDITVVNMIAQSGVFWSTNKTPIKYDALEQCLAHVVELNPKTVHMPKIGCGLAGGDWNKVVPIIEDTLIYANIPVFVYTL